MQSGDWFWIPICLAAMNVELSDLVLVPSLPSVEKVTSKHSWLACIYFAALVTSPGCIPPLV